MTDIPHGAMAPAADRAAQKYYFIAWRWHFYAGLYVIPFMLILAVTGLIMLWISWIDGRGAEHLTVTRGGQMLAVSQLQDIAENAVPGGQAVRYVEPLDVDRVAVFSVASDGVQTGVALNPYTGEVLHSFPWRAGWYDFASDIHGTLLLGDFGDLMIEIAASLAIVLIATGLYLSWPRGEARWRDTLIPRLSASGRGFWKSVHGALGTWMSLILLLFLLSGLSWAGVWGGRMVQAWNTFPADKWGTPLSDATHTAMGHGAPEVPWTLEQTPMPQSGSLAGVDAIQGDVTIDSVVDFARGLGFDGRFQLNLPANATGVWSISHDSMSNDGPNPAADRTIHIDRYSGNVLADVQYADYSAYAKAMAWGIAFHEGDLGIWNLILNTVFCLAVILVSVSGLVMWWKRRPARSTKIAAPPKPRDLPLWKGAAALVVVLGVLFPMGGLAIVAVLILDWTVLRMLPGVRQALS